MSSKSTKENTLLFVPNMVGYIRLALLLVSVFMETRLFVYFYGASYILDALDGYLARAFSQESTFGYVLDMALDRASSSVLFLRVAVENPIFLPYMSLLVILDLLSHFVSMSYGYVAKKSHKSYNKNTKNNIEKVLSIYYNRTVLFLVCLMTEVFALNLLYTKSFWAHCISTPFFVFKQATNIMQLYNGMIYLGIMY
ncbi:CDP-diacylglycerol--inositol 3-phosphatidyltransferase [Nematocida sp. AWRm77]|nr:CDP-diacylglycerol--inositol 3-phosphatidyltransferase [Nematocida sp. AWRm77]